MLHGNKNALTGSGASSGVPQQVRIAKKQRENTRLVLLVSFHKTSAYIWREDALALYRKLKKVDFFILSVFSVPCVKNGDSHLSISPAGQVAGWQNYF